MTHTCIIMLKLHVHVIIIFYAVSSKHKYISVCIIHTSRNHCVTPILFHPSRDIQTHIHFFLILVYVTVSIQNVSSGTVPSIMLASHTQAV